MKLHELTNVVTRKRRKRVGRGDASGRGRTCGRGDKGAGARSGNSRRPHFEGGQLPLFRRLPKRGFKNPNHRVYNVVNVRALEEHFSAGDEVTEEVLRQHGLVGGAHDGLKMLGDGELTKALKVKAAKFSAIVREKIEKAGGTCETV